MININPILWRFHNIGKRARNRKISQHRQTITKTGDFDIYNILKCQIERFHTIGKRARNRAISQHRQTSTKSSDFTTSANDNENRRFRYL